MSPSRSRSVSSDVVGIDKRFAAPYASIFGSRSVPIRSSFAACWFTIPRRLSIRAILERERTGARPNSLSLRRRSRPRSTAPASPCVVPPPSSPRRPRPSRLRPRRLASRASAVASCVSASPRSPRRRTLRRRPLPGVGRHRACPSRVDDRRAGSKQGIFGTFGFTTIGNAPRYATTAAAPASSISPPSPFFAELRHRVAEELPLVVDPVQEGALDFGVRPAPEPVHRVRGQVRRVWPSRLGVRRGREAVPVPLELLAVAPLALPREHDQLSPACTSASVKLARVERNARGRRRGPGVLASDVAPVGRRVASSPLPPSPSVAGADPGVGERRVRVVARAPDEAEARQTESHRRKRQSESPHGHPP